MRDSQPAGTAIAPPPHRIAVAIVDAGTYRGPEPPGPAAVEKQVRRFEGTGSMPLAPRYELALEALDLREHHQVLEVGCGYGVAVGLIADRLGPAGRIHAIDRSPKMIVEARRRNEAHMRRGTVSFEVTEIVSASLPEHTFDRVLAIRVRDLWAKPHRTVPGLQRCLRPGGRLVAVLDAPGRGADDAAVAGLHRQLLDHGFREVIVLTSSDATATALVAQTAT